MATAPRATGANLIADSFTQGRTHCSLALSAAERAVVAAELARLRARVADLAARLDRVQAALAGPQDRGGETRVVPAPITRVPARTTSHPAAAGPVTASGARS
jgi:hypothetical protein